MRRTGPCASRARPSASFSYFLRTESRNGTGAAPSASAATKPLRSDSRAGVDALCGGRPHSVVVGLVKHERLVPLSTTTGGVADGSVFSVKRSRTTAIKFFSASAATALTGRQSRNNFRRLARRDERTRTQRKSHQGTFLLLKFKLDLSRFFASQAPKQAALGQPLFASRSVPLTCAAAA